MLEAVPNSDATQNPGDGGSTGVTDGDGGTRISTETVVTAARPDWLPEAYWDADENTAKADDLAARLTRADELEAADAARREGVPAGADEYKLDLPENVVGLDGKPVQLIADHPATKEAKSLAAELGLSQAAFTRLMAFHAAQVLAEQRTQAETFQAEMKAELEKLGGNHKARVDAVVAGLTGHLGDKAQHLVDVMATAGAVEALEALIAKAAQPALSATHQAAAEARSLADRMYS